MNMRLFITWFIQPVLGIVLMVLIYGMGLALEPREILLRGPWDRIDTAAVSEVIQSYGRHHQYFYSLRELHDHLVVLPWVKDVVIRRERTGQLYIGFSSIEPIARLTSGRWLGVGGEVIYSSFTSPSLEKMPIFDGEEGDFKLMITFYHQLDALAKHLKWHLKQISYHAISKQWTLEFSDHMIVRLGNSSHALVHFKRWIHALPVLESRGVESRGHYFDMRYPDGFAVGKL